MARSASLLPKAIACACSKADTVLGDISVPGGPVIIEASGSIHTRQIDAFASFGDGGEISLTAANGDIETGNLNSYSNVGNGIDSGGAITITANHGNISTGSLESRGFESGGAIAITANQGSISINDIESAGAESGGAIAITADRGNIRTNDLNSRSFGPGGAITITANQGSISTDSLDSHSNQGHGGAIAITAQGNITTNGLNSQGYGLGGAISVTANQGNISINDINSLGYHSGGAVAITANQGSISIGHINSSAYYFGFIPDGFGGAIAITAQGNISINEIFSGAYYYGFGAAISVTANQGNISIGNINSYGYHSAGAISITADRGNIRTNQINSNAHGFGGAIAITANQGNITITHIYSVGTSNGGEIILDAGKSITLLSINKLAPSNAQYGDINLTANEINFTDGINSIWGDNTKLTIQAKTPSKGIIIGGTTDSGTTTLDLLTTDLAAIKNGFTSITIGQANNTGTITLNPYNFNAPVNIAGGSTLVGLNQNTTWTITGTDAGTISGFPNGLTFSSIENLIGGSADDTFIFNNGTNISGTINGSGGTDILDYSRYTSPITVNLANNSLQNIEQVIGGAGSDTIIGANTDNSWVVAANNIGTINNIFSFYSFETLIGGTAKDTFLFNSGKLDNFTVDANLGNDSITVNSPTNLTGNVSLSTGADGGDITINNTLDGGANLTLSAGTGNITFGGSLGKIIPLGNLTINSAHNLIGGDITAASITHNNGTGTIVLGNLQTKNGSVNLATANDLTTGNITTSGREINLTSQRGIINTGNLNSSGTSGGNITVNAAISITAGDINSSGLIRDGGNIILDPISDIQVSTINAQGGSNGKGGNVDITTQRFFRATGSFLDRNGIETSISTAGGLGGGDITIRHGGNGLVPFYVGNASTNGTIGAISSGSDNTISPSKFFLFNYTQDNISIITEGLDIQSQNQIAIALESQNRLPRNLPTSIPSVSINTPEQIASIVTGIEDSFTAQFTNYLGLTSNPYTGVTQSNQNSYGTDKTGNTSATNNNPEKNIQAAIKTLSNAEAATGVKPALIYVVFAPDTIDSSPEANTPQTVIEKLLNKQNSDSNSVTSTNQPNSSTHNPKPQPTDELQLILVTAEGEPILKTIPDATREKVIAMADKFRREITRPIKPNSTSYLKPSQQLYQWTVAQLETELKEREIDNLVFIMDTHLRSLPIAALHDGKGFLIERYSIGLMPSLSLVDTRYADIKNSQVLGMGASQFQDQNPLPAASEEVKLITQKLWQGQSFIEENFTFNKLVSEREKTPFGIIHLATHGEFEPGDPSNSYIQLSDRKLGLDKLRELGWNNPPVELLVLSACRTALGDEEAELGFAGLAVQAGVKTAVASLWYVSDEGTLALMTEFYRQLKEAPIKAEALRRAQLALMKGEVRLEGGELRGSAENIPLPPELVNLGDKNLSHPYYWSAFTMIGSPW